MVKKSTKGKFNNKHYRMFKHGGEGRKQIKENSCVPKCSPDYKTI